MIKPGFSYDVIIYNTLCHLKKKVVRGHEQFKQHSVSQITTLKIRDHIIQTVVNLTDKKTIKLKITLSSDTNAFINK